MNEIDFEIFKEDFKTEIIWRKLIYNLYNKKLKYQSLKLIYSSKNYK